MKLAAVIPCFRVRRHIAEVVAGVLPYVDHVFVVDDCCPELTGDLVAAMFPPDRVTVLRHPENRGVGGATVTGYCAAFAARYDIAIKIDGDGQMDPAHIPDLVHPIIAGEADYTKGNRFYQREHLARMPKVRLFGNSVLSLITKVSSGYWNIMDPTNGYTALHATAAQEIGLARVDRRYFFESDMLFRLNIARAVVKDVPMPAIYGTEKSNLPIRHVLHEFPAKHLKNLVKRFAYNYLVRDFSVGTIQIVTGTALTGFGVIFGAISWIQSAAASRDTPVGTVMLATLPIILGFQLLLAALSFDIANVPVRPLQRILRPKPWSDHQSIEIDVRDGSDTKGALAEDQELRRQEIEG
ncbi:Glycosyl transferase, group 2 family protein [Rubellimicrobium mesophilum DSM 19309]|uniref:Glycosyl transferase, group 2 family protein n=1 Tax=Rubellimicrobium mesophilum DSM 19309 TaxID=442562 RepID=A0A017HV72_9RHOB|nr:glycosyltransferase [Rubellimicrobium mesophilum]EYD78402.1 Glycosyl transferase, group 2 family protein [Rubellimicrobium mesophilum DSM 19309]